jgi:NTE family protein
MPFGSEGLSDGAGLALSGGGFRATLFHCGSLWRLNELGVLKNLVRISSVSGGSITAGALAVAWPRLVSASWSRDAFVKELVTPLRKLCSRDVDIPSVLKGAVVPGKSIADFVADQYAETLVGDATLQTLPDNPSFVFNSTNLATGVDFRFSKPYAGDYRIGLIRNPTFKLATVVAASSAFPPFLSPVECDTDPASFEKVSGADLYDDISFRKQLKLTDGGVYDNLGLETVSKRFKTLLVSDAGAPFDYGGVQGSDWPRQALRVISILTHQAWSLRLRALIADYRTKARDGAYWGIGTDILKFEVAGALPVAPKVAEELANVRTRLNSFSEAEQCSLINWGYAICDASIRRSGGHESAPAPAWPYPEYALDRGVSEKVKVETAVKPPVVPDFS